MATQRKFSTFFLFQNLKIWERLAIGFSLIIAVLIAGLTVTNVIGVDIERKVETVYSESILKTKLLDKLSQQAHIVSQSLGLVLLLRGADGTTDQLENIERAGEAYDKTWEALGKTPGSMEENRARAQIAAAAEIARGENNKVIALAAQSHHDLALQHLLATRDKIKSWESAVDEHILILNRQNAAIFDTVRADFAEARRTALSFGGIAVVISLLLAWLNVRAVSKPFHQIQATIEKMKAGDIKALQEITSRDEIGDLGRTVHALLQERIAKNDTLNDAIMDIMRAVAKTAEGDLTVNAPVRKDITGALADAINEMTESTAKTIATVTCASREVRSASQQGRETVIEASRGMSSLRGTIQETGKRIKRLGERSQEITGIVKLIDDIAERTSVLALNANMQAAMAGDAGRGFRVVADEVQRLAERSKQATDQVAKLVGTIQTETHETMQTMDRAISEVVKGGDLTNKAAQQAQHLDELGSRLLESVQAFKLPDNLMTGSAGGTLSRAA